MTCMATRHMGGGGGGGVGSVANPASTVCGGFLEKFWLQGCKVWGIFPCSTGELVLYYIYREV